LNEKDFYLKQQAAVERMREMNMKAQTKNSAPSEKPPANQPQNQQPNTANNKNNAKIQNSNRNIKADTGGLNIPFLETLFRDGDTTLIVGLLLLLMSEKGDKLLLFALVYILL